MSFPLTGLIAATYTPCHADGSLNLDAVPRLAQHLLDSGVSGVFVAGTTGECHSLSLQERTALTTAWCTTARDRLTVVVHVGSNCLADAQQLAGHAREAGAHAISAMSPFFFKPPDLDALLDYCHAIAEAGGELPFYFYHIPPMTGVDLPMSQFMGRALRQIPTFAGLKFSSGNLAQLQACLHLADGKLDLLFGQDQNLLAALALGARGAIGSTYNYAAPLYHRILQAFEAGDLETCRQAQVQSVEMVRTLEPFDVLTAGKAIMKLVGIDCGPVRPPLKPLDGDQLEQLEQQVRRLPAFDGCLRSQAAVDES